LDARSHNVVIQGKQVKTQYSNRLETFQGNSILDISQNNKSWCSHSIQDIVSDNNYCWMGNKQHHSTDNTNTPDYVWIGKLSQMNKID
jgi:hypothetical protein